MIAQLFDGLLLRAIEVLTHQFMIRDSIVSSQCVVPVTNHVWIIYLWC